MVWQEAGAALAALAQDPGSWWAQVAGDRTAVLAWDGESLVVRWAGNPALWIDATPRGLLVRVAEEYRAVSPPGYRVVLGPGQAAPVPGVLAGLEDLGRRFAAFRRRAMRHPHPQGAVVDAIARREPCVAAVALTVAPQAPVVDLLLVHPQAVATCWLVRRAEAVRTPQGRRVLARQAAAVRSALGLPATLATVQEAVARWRHVPAAFAQRRAGVEVARLHPEPAVLLTDFLPELRPAVADWAALLRQAGVPLVGAVAQAAHFGPRQWSALLSR